MAYGYGKDIAYMFTKDGRVDFEITAQGDLKIVGGTGEEVPLEIRRKNAWQSVALRILTPRHSLRDPDDPTGERKLSFGSLIYDIIGNNFTPEVEMFIRGQIVLAIMESPFVDRIERIQIVEGDTPSVRKVNVGLVLKGDDEVLYETFPL